MSSTEPVQEKETSGENAQRNPEMNVGQDGAQQVAGTAVGYIGQMETSDEGI